MSDNVSSSLPTFSRETGHFFIISCYLGFSTLTKAAFAFSILTLLCTHFEQTSSHLNPIHQRASFSLSPPPPPRLSSAFLMLFKPAEVY